MIQVLIDIPFISNLKPRRSKDVHPHVISHARELFSILQERNSAATLKWVVKSCSTRVIPRLKMCLELNKDILGLLTSYTLTQDDRKKFESLFPSSIPLKEPSLQALSQYVAKIMPSDNPAAMNDRISVGNVEQWLKAVGDLPQILDALLIRPNNGTKTPIRDIKISDKNLDNIVYIYLTLQRSVKLFTKTDITEFLSQLPCFLDGNPLIYLTLFVY